MNYKLIIGILSGPKNREARQAIRETWMKNSKDLGVLCVFLMGDYDGVWSPELRGDELMLPMEEKYKNLPQKTRWFCRWANINHQFDYLFKCDDDTYVDVKKLVEMPKRDHYIGCPCAVGVASGGAGYLLSKPASYIVATQMETKQGSEDVLVAQTLAKHGINLTPSTLFDPAHNSRNHIIPLKENNQITTHYVSPTGMKMIYDRNLS